MKTSKSCSKEAAGAESASQLIDAKIKSLADWRGKTLAHVRTLYVVRVFVQLRAALLDHKALADKLTALERRVSHHDNSLVEVIHTTFKPTVPHRHPDHQQSV